MKILLLPLLLAAALSLNAQNCKYNVNMKDTISGKDMIITKPLQVWKNGPDGREMFFKGMKSDNAYYLDVKFINSIKFTIPKGMPLTFVLADNSVVTLKAMDDKGKDHQKLSGGRVYCVAIFNLPDKDRQKIADKKPVSITLSTREGKVKMPLSKKQVKKIAQLMQCLAG
jgi:hypothetical protein